MNDSTWTTRRAITLVLIAANSILLLAMAFKVIEPYWYGLAVQTQATSETRLELPEYDYSSWASWPVLEEGRIKPLQTVAIETVRKITGRASLDGQKAMPIFMSWLFYVPQQKDKNKIDWDNYPIILCEDHELRAAIYGVDKDDPQHAEKVHSKRISPNDLYKSVPFQRLVVAVNRKRDVDPDHYKQSLEPLERKAESVSDRFGYYQLITGSMELRNKAATERENRRLLADPVHYVALDKVPNSSWFSMGELRYITTTMRAPMLSPQENANMAWWDIMSQRVSLLPRLYLSEEVRKSLESFQQALKENQIEPVIRDLEAVFQKRADSQVAASRKSALEQLDKMSEADFTKFAASMGQANLTKQEMKKKITEMMPPESETTVAKDRVALKNLKQSIQNVRKPFIVDDERHNQMYMAYLEIKHPDMYLAAIKSQPFPETQAKQVLAAYDAVGNAYRSGNGSEFQNATLAFQKTLTEVSKEFTQGNYPGENTTQLELTLNRVEPFKWAWISMLAAVILFALSLRLDNRALYFAGFAPLLISLGFQIFAYYGRVMISGRPPVSNMFETVVFVASMGAVFALMLECYYRNTIIILAGSIVATLGMILADQLPYSRGFDAKIDPLVPVLRSNYWLIIHVMTIVASYAAGALAWAIGNISLVLYWFNSDRRDLLKNLSNLCYSAIKVAVLLLGVGTLLGGIWAAESWGRFWGWDPKETWALIALVVYLLPLHARYIGWVKDFGMAIASVVCFSAIVMSWYGVNFILGAGLHSYGMGDGGPWTIFLIGSINLMWVLLVCLKRINREMSGQEQAA